MFTPLPQQMDFPLLEKELLEKWYSQGIVKQYLEKNTHSSKHFSFLDGPITANNPMGVHHAWGRTYKDLWQRFYNMQGYKQRFQNGFDCQGLWVEVEVEKELGIRNKRDIENLIEGDKKASIAKFVQLCKERVKKFSGIQTEQSKRLGYFMDWENSYFTMSDENNYMIWHFLSVCNEKGWIYKGKDSVPWCPRCQTAISQHEMLTEDYKEITHETIFVKLPITTPGWEDTSLVIWTTTPWTVPANVAVGINTSYTYGVISVKDAKERVVILLRDNTGVAPTRMIKKKEVSLPEYLFGTQEITVHKEISGKELLGLTYRGPFDHLPLVTQAKQDHPDTFHTVVDGSAIVTATEGTGLLHVAPGAGKEDFDLGKKEHLSVISPINDEAFYGEGMDEFSGKNAKKHPELIFDYLKSPEKNEFFLKTMPYTHRYPACWRCKTELVWKVAEEWYIAMDLPDSKTKQTLREQMIEVAKTINWHPSFGRERELDWLANMHDWLISKKNRYWGLALPIYDCSACGKFTVVSSKKQLQEKAVRGWESFSRHTPHKPYIDDVIIACDYCGKEVSRIDDVGNVWLDAGIVPFSTLIDPKTNELSYTGDKSYWKEWFPIDFITESFPGQFKNWFYSLIAMATVLEKTHPFKTVLGYASVLAEDGRPMHKSWGNSIEFNEGADKIGVDVMRWMYISTDPNQNLLFGYKKADEIRRRFHLMIWNIVNFFLTYAQVDAWVPQEEYPTPDNVLDTWILQQLDVTITQVTNALTSYDPHLASVSLEAFINDLSLWYIRRSRDRVGPSVTDSKDKQSFYSTCHFVLVTLMKLLAPFVPFLSEYIFSHLITSKESVHVQEWPLPQKTITTPSLLDEMKHAMKLASAIHAFRKSAGVKVRIPLKKLTYHGLQDISQEVLAIVLEETNVYSLTYRGKSEEYMVEGDTSLENQDLIAGQARDIIRAIQEERKKLHTTLDEQINVDLPTWPEAFEEEIKRKTLIKTLKKHDTFAVHKI